MLGRVNRQRVMRSEGPVELSQEGMKRLKVAVAAMEVASVVT